MSEQRTKGELLASGKGIATMLQASRRLKLTRENSILEVDEPRAYNSGWRIYELKDKEENESNSK